MEILNTNLLKEIQIYPSSIIEDIEISMISEIEGFEIKNILANKNIPKICFHATTEILFKLFESAEKLVNRENVNEKDIHFYDVSDDINVYYFRAELKDNKLTFKYVEEGRKYCENDTIEIGDIEKSKRVISAFFDMINEIEED